MKRALFSATAAAAIVVAAIAGSATTASAAHGGHGGGIGGFGGAGIRTGGLESRGLGGPAIHSMPGFRPSGTVGVAPERFTAPQRFTAPRAFSAPRTAQNWNRGYWDRRHHRFVRGGAFFAFGAAYPYWDYGYYDSCWRWELTRFGWQWVNICYPYSPYYY